MWPPTLTTGISPSSGQFAGQTFSGVSFGSSNLELMQATNLNGGDDPTNVTFFTIYTVSDTGEAAASNRIGFGAKENPFGNNSTTNNFQAALDSSFRYDNGSTSGDLSMPSELFIRVSRFEYSAGGAYVTDFFYDGNGREVNIATQQISNDYINVDKFYIGDTNGSNSDAVYSVVEVLAFNAALTNNQIAAVIPEPHTYAMLAAVGVLGLAVGMRRFRKK